MRHHIGQTHYIYTAGEGLVQYFHGAVPRRGEIVHSLEGKPLRVVEVKWYLDKWYKDPETPARGEVTLSQARLLVEPLDARECACSKSGECLAATQDPETRQAVNITRAEAEEQAGQLRGVGWDLWPQLLARWRVHKTNRI